MSTRFTLEYKGRRAKIRKGETYSYIMKRDCLSLEVHFQEQPATRSENVHTHVWVHNLLEEEAMPLIAYLLNEAVYHPKALNCVCLVEAWDLEKDKEDADYVVELLVTGKLSQPKIEFTLGYLAECYEAVYGYAAMTSLFGE